MIYKKIKALAKKNTATLVDVTTTFTHDNLTQAQIKQYQTLVNAKTDVVILPIEYSIEHYREIDNHIASYGNYASFEYDENSKKAKVGFKCTSRCKIVKIYVDKKDVSVDIELIENQEILAEYKPIMDEIYNRFKEYLKYDDVDIATIEAIKAPTNLENYIQNVVLATKFEVSAKRKLLEELDPLKRLAILNSELETRLFEQKSDKGKDIFSYYKSRINELDLSADIKRSIYDELTRLKATKQGQSEYGNIIDWLDRIIALPWNNYKTENTDIEYAKRMLNETHYGMDKLKQRILDYIALRMISGRNSSQIMCLYGPPGVGKSTIVKSIAKALNKDFYGFSLGGLSNPEEINGMPRYFIGAKPGRILEGITQAKSKNCIILLDEIDKMSSNGNRGDPYSVLLDVLDKNQNKEFKDRYFDVPFDISQVMFIATANSLSTIPEPLRNRIEIINIEGYSVVEKVHIAQEYVLKKTLRELGLKEDLISINASTMQKLIEEYTFESGVRQLERLVSELCKKYLISLQLENKPLKKTTISLNKAREYLGKFYEEEYNTAMEGEVGVVNKMSVSGPVGAVSRLEISLVKGNGEQILSDNLVGTAKWTFKTVFGLVKSRAIDWNIDLKVFEENNFYIHSPHHAISHDGPSGGVADVICLLSAIKDIPVNHKIAFTGEISLKGKVLAIGGLREKLLAAQRNRMETVVIPLQNKKDVEELSEEVVGSMNIKYVDNIDEAYNFIFNRTKGEKNESRTAK